MLNPHTETLHAIVEECYMVNPEDNRALLVLLRRVQDGSRPDYGSIQLYKKGGGRYLEDCWMDTKWMGDLTAEECQAYVDRKVKEWGCEAPNDSFEELDQTIGQCKN
jgi:hypothetical protein